MRRVAGWLAWWIPLAAFWLLLVDNTRTSDMLGGAAAAAVAATVGELVAEQRLLGLRLRPRFLRHLPRALLRLPAESWTVTAALVRHLIARKPVSGSFRVISFPVGHDDPDSTTRRALAKGFDSVGPNNYVVGIDAEEDLMLVHQLVTREDAESADPMDLRRRR
jgi:multisubunit Na+/H+ antiporter MnhE subunit